MMVIKITVAALVIGFPSWLSGKKPELAGFIIALPIASLLALLFSYIEHKDTAASVTFAKSIMIGVPVSWLFCKRRSTYAGCLKNWQELISASDFFRREIPRQAGFDLL